MSKISNILAEFTRQGITYKVSDQLNGWRVFLYGGDDEIRKKFQANLWNEKEPQKLEAGKSESTEQGNNDTASVAKIVQQVFAKETSLTEKVQMLNKFAGGYFVAKDFANAQLLLEKALEIDSHHLQTLTNLAILAKVQGDGDKALAYVAKMQEVDFVLLQRIMG